MSHIPVPFAPVPLQLIRSKMSRNAKALYCIIVAFTSVRNRSAWPSNTLLCLHLGCNKDSLRLYKQELIASGWLIQERRRDEKGRLGHWNLYPQYVPKKPPGGELSLPEGNSEAENKPEVAPAVVAVAVTEEIDMAIEEFAAPAMVQEEDVQVEEVPAVDACAEAKIVSADVACADAAARVAAVSTANSAVQEAAPSAALPEEVSLPMASAVEAPVVVGPMDDASPGEKASAVPANAGIPLRQQAMELPAKTEASSSPPGVLDIAAPQLQDDTPATYYLVKDGSRKIGTISREQYLGICWQIEQTKKSGRLENEVGLWNKLLILGVKGRFNLVPYRNATKVRIGNEMEERRKEWEKQKAEAATPDQIKDLCALFKSGKLPPEKLD